ncbi:hypothetical protein CYY_007028 [Polysphondylium violaceum]|uniref:Uncharacterized protein n=1 Tax=Polysphondylium violaceum TaxID=133409 RepID=A0A8J4UYA5_9MYCE|nr:hypothetical protein CYY_007028 [Polysphondylium violaceum]
MNAWIIKEETDYNEMVWKNGKGKSIQVHIEPPNMTLQDPFDWRISSAVIGIAGPFSSFEGYQRTVVILKGNKLSLYHRQKPNETINLDYFQPYGFDGGWDTDSEFTIPSPSQKQQQHHQTTTEETHDFSVITKQNLYHHTCRILAFGHHHHHKETICLDSISDRSHIILYNYGSQITVEQENPGKSTIQCKLEPKQTLIIKDLMKRSSSSSNNLIIKCTDHHPNENSKVIFIVISPLVSSSTSL